MIRKKVESNLERQFLIAMITSKPFVSGCAYALNVELLPTRYVQQIAQWCIDYFMEYGDAPNKSIESLYHSWVANEKPEPGDADAIHDFLEAMSDQFDNGTQINAPYLLDELSAYLTLRKISVLKDTIESSLLYGRREEALEAIQSFRSVPKNEEMGFSLIGRGPLQRAFAEKPEPLMDFPPDAAWFFDSAFTRDSLIGVQGPEKRGKTYWCLEFLYRAVRCHRTVAMFQVGDLSEAQLVKRMAVRVARLPLWASQCVGIQVPRKIEVVKGVNSGWEAVVTTALQKFPHPIDYDSAYRAQKKFNRLHKIDKRRPTMKFSIHANSSINVAGIDAILQRWRHELNFTPDVIIIDYADILAPENSKLEARHQVNETWKALRKLSQEWHACVIAPTQANAASYGAKTQKMANFSEDKRKLAHVTGMLGLNQTEKEKEQGVMRLNWIVLRESEFHANQCLWVAQCIPLGVALAKATRG